MVGIGAVGVCKARRKECVVAVLSAVCCLLYVVCCIFYVEMCCLLYVVLCFYSMCAVWCLLYDVFGALKGECSNMTS